MPASQPSRPPDLNVCWVSGCLGVRATGAGFLRNIAGVAAGCMLLQLLLLLCCAAAGWPVVACPGPPGLRVPVWHTPPSRDGPLGKKKKKKKLTNRPPWTRTLRAGALAHHRGTSGGFLATPWAARCDMRLARVYPAAVDDGEQGTRLETGGARGLSSHAPQQRAPHPSPGALSLLLSA